MQNDPQQQQELAKRLLDLALQTFVDAPILSSHGFLRRVGSKHNEAYQAIQRAAHQKPL